MKNPFADDNFETSVEKMNTAVIKPVVNTVAVSVKEAIMGPTKELTLEEKQKIEADKLKNINETRANLKKINDEITKIRAAKNQNQEQKKQEQKQEKKQEEKKKNVKDQELQQRLKQTQGSNESNQRVSG